MKKIILSFIMLIYCLFNLFSIDILQFKDVKEKINNSSNTENDEYIKTIINAKIKWQGLILKINSNNQDSDNIYVEMDKPNKKKLELIPDVFFILDKKVSTRLSELQFIVFIGYIDGIKNIDDKLLICIREIYLQGVMK